MDNLYHQTQNPSAMQTHQRLLLRRTCSNYISGIKPFKRLIKMRFLAHQVEGDVEHLTCTAFQLGIFHLPHKVIYVVIQQALT